jgi:threonine synthase
MNLTCMECNSSYDPKDTRFLCDCGGLLDVRLDLEGVAVSREVLDARLAGAALPGGSGVWRYRELLPSIPDEHIVSKGEGNTNLYADKRLHAWTGCDGLHLKHEGENPTGSFKDRGMTVGMSHARWTGARSVACASTGNTSASVSAYAAAAGIQGLTFVPEGKLALGKLVQTMGYGARTVQVRGDFDDAMRLVQQVAGGGGVGLLNSLNPYRLEGQKSIIFEILQQLDWSVPDWIVVPGGNLGNTSSFGKALHELRQVGLIKKMPRLAVIQAAGANPFYQAFRDGFRSFTPVAADTVATAIRIGNPVNYPKAVRSLEWTDGVVEQVTDEEILEAKNRVDTVGIGCEPASAASLAGLRKLVSRGTVRAGDGVVAVLTGHILKDPDSILDHQERFGISLETVEPDIDAVTRLLGG